MSKSHLLMGAAAFAVAISVTQPAFAQDPPAPCADDNANGVCDSDESNANTNAGADDQTIIVSGSRIARPNLDANVPVTTIQAGEILDDGSLSLGDALNDLPSLRSTFSTSNSQRFIGTTGLNILDLRGLGTSRTLTLVNGRRHVTSSVGSFQVDVNTIPFELLDRVDVVTGGSSAVYGSDAIAGVVNFVLKRDFEGLNIQGQAGISDRKDNGRYSLSGTWGMNFADGRGNIAVAAEYTHTELVFNTQRDSQTGAFSGFVGLANIEDATDDPGASNTDGIPDLGFRDHLRYGFISDGGTFTGICVSDATVQPLGCAANGQDAIYRFLPDGSLIREDAQFINDYRRFGDSFVEGGTGSTLANTQSLFPEIDRYNINLLTHFDVSDAFRPYGEFKYARIDAKFFSTPSFENSFCGGLAGAVGLGGVPACYNSSSAATFIRYDNAFLDPAAATQIAAVQNELLAAFGVPPVSSGFSVNRNNVDFGSRGEDLRRQTWRGVVGAEGTFNDDWRYDVSVTYGKYKERFLSNNNLIVDNFERAVDAAFAPDGTVQCRVNVDADTTNNDAACVPINIFGYGKPSQAALDYVNTTSRSDGKASQLDFLAFIGGDTSGFFNFPGGPLRFVVGTEYRRETSSSFSDALSASGATFLNAFQPFNPPAFKVLEGFAEIELPILANMPFAEELTLSAAGRVSDYNSGAGNTGTVYTYNANAIYAPIPDIRARVNYSRAVRAPTPGDLFSPATQNFLFLSDPCDVDNINNGTATRESNCRADGVPVGYDQASGNRSVLQSGNPGLEAETSNSFTAGVILEPRFLPGFSATFDYYDIKVNKVIANISGNQILQNCYDAPDLSNQFCDLVNVRQPDGSFDPNAALFISPVNFASLTARGIDADIRYDHTFDNDNRLSLRMIATHVIDRTNFLDIDNPDDPNRVKSELGDPEWAANFSASYRAGPFTLNYDIRFIGKTTISVYEDYFPNKGPDPVTGEIVTLPPQDEDVTERTYYPNVFYHDIRLDIKVNDKYNFYMGVDNVFDRLPPFGLTGNGGGSGIFNNIGRFFYAGFRASL